jgi:hypothetical protein
MPSHTIQSALIKLYQLDAAPWKWQAWKDITGIHHGIFPEDDNLLPQGFTRPDVLAIKSYFDQYQAQPSEEAKIKFSAQTKGPHVVGRNKWREWITAGWKSWKIHSRITDVLTNESLHPLTIMLNSNDLETWPQGDTYLPLAVDAVAANLFGDESLDTSGRLSAPYRHITQLLVQRSWINIHRQTVRNKNRLGALEDAATRAFNGKGSLRWFFGFLVSSFHRRLRHHRTCKGLVESPASFYWRLRYGLLGSVKLCPQLFSPVNVPFFKLLSERRLLQILTTTSYRKPRFLPSYGLFLGGRTLRNSFPPTQLSRR